MPYPQIPRNRPIATLIEWYCDKKSGKVTDARKEIQKRFNYQDWEDQERIVMAFLQSGEFKEVYNGLEPKSYGDNVQLR